jgi:hypothetical protein
MPHWQCGSDTGNGLTTGTGDTGESVRALSGGPAARPGPQAEAAAFKSVTVTVEPSPSQAHWGGGPRRAGTVTVGPTARPFGVPSVRRSESPLSLPACQ